MRRRSLVAAVIAAVPLGSADASPDATRTFLVTAYCEHGITATGTYTRQGTIAVDPRVIPLGSRMTVAGYGRGRALDTGGLIKGYRADVWFSTCTQAIRWGARRVSVRWAIPARETQRQGRK